MRTCPPVITTLGTESVMNFPGGQRLTCCHSSSLVELSLFFGTPLGEGSLNPTSWGLCPMCLFPLLILLWVLLLMRIQSATVCGVLRVFLANHQTWRESWGPWRRNKYYQNWITKPYLYWKYGNTCFEILYFLWKNETTILHSKWKCVFC